MNLNHMEPTNGFTFSSDLSVNKTVKSQSDCESDNERDCLFYEPILPFVRGKLGWSLGRFR